MAEDNKDEVATATAEESATTTEEPPQETADAAPDAEEDAEEEEEERIRGGGKITKDSGRQNRKFSPYSNDEDEDDDEDGGEGDNSKNCRVYVGNLSWKVSWQDLKDHMREAGEVTRADIMTGPDGRSKGCGIVEFATPEAAQKAVETLTDTDLNGRQIFVREDREDRGGSSRGGGGGGGGGNRFSSDDGAQSRRVYVGNLSWDVAWQDLKDHMREAGEVVHAEVITEANGRSKGCGICEFATRDEAQKAISTLTDTELKGRMIFVREDRESSGHSGGYGRGSGFGSGSKSVYIWNLSYDTSWQDLKDHCRAAGNVDNASILTGPDGKSLGCGVVVYQHPKDAARAIRDLQKSELNGRPINLREDRVQSGGRRGGRQGGRPYRGGGGNNNNSNNNSGGGGGGDGCQLFVGNLSYQTSWQDLKDHFAKCGDVDHVQVIEGPGGRKKGFGTVRFSSAEDAEKAIQELHGEELDGRTLEVRLDNRA